LIDSGRMRETLLSLWAWALTGFLVVAWFPLMAVVWLFDTDPVRYRTGRLFRRLGALLTYVNPFWDIEVLGDPPDDMRGPYVVVSNHLSHADVPIISRLPWEMKWVGKRELFHIPIAGWMMQMARDIEVDRGNKRSRAQVLVRARRLLEADCPVMFFPEGTRSRDGRIHRFAEGPFRLAIRESARILPLAIDGTREALPKHSWKFNDPGTTMRLKVLPPVDTTGMDTDDARSLAEEVRQQIVAEVAGWRGEPPEAVDALASRPAAQDSDRKESVNPSAESSRSEPAS
jgi:1-acyl-sn-glycerol-3-phosphate acyltransferase